MKTCLAAVLVCLVAVPVAAAKKESSGLRAGAATSNITPPLGGAIIGGFVPFPAKHVHDELHVKCLALDDGKTRLVLAVCDLLGLHVRVSKEARKLIQERLGIPAEQVLISATHTHSACSALGQDRYKLDQPLDDYQKFVVARIVDAAQIAVNSLRPAELAFGTAQAPEHVFNRRWLLKPGTMPPNPFGGIDQAKMNPGGPVENLVEPAGPTDPTISIIAVRERGGRPISVYSAYSLHYVGGVGPAHISADYYGMYCRELSRLLKADEQDPPFVALMANGTSGDINNINFRNRGPRQEPYAQMRKVACDVAAKVCAALEKLTYRSDISLAARYREPVLTWRRPTTEQVEWAKKTIAESKPQPGKADLPVIYAQRTLQLVDVPDRSPIPVQALRIGDVCIGTIPCEVLCEIGLEFRKRAPQQPAFLVSLAHGYLGYLPPPRQHALGGYETWLGTNRLEVQASVKLLDNLVEMAAEMKAVGKK